MSTHLIIENHLQKIPRSSSKVKAYLFCFIHKTASKQARWETIRNLGKSKSIFFSTEYKSLSSLCNPNLETKNIYVSHRNNNDPIELAGMVREKPQQPCSSCLALSFSLIPDSYFFTKCHLFFLKLSRKKNNFISWNCISSVFAPAWFPLSA